MESFGCGTETDSLIGVPESELLIIRLMRPSQTLCDGPFVLLLSVFDTLSGQLLFSVVDSQQSICICHKNGLTLLRCIFK